ncbi:MAG: hypothetical protein R2825_20550 [Saprospiraceae bacterium]
MPSQLLGIVCGKTGKAPKPLMAAQYGHNHDGQHIFQGVTLTLPTPWVAKARHKIKQFVVHDSPFFCQRTDYFLEPISPALKGDLTLACRKGRLDSKNQGFNQPIFWKLTTGFDVIPCGVITLA